MTRRYTGGFLSAKEQITDVNTANGIFTLSDNQALTAQGNFPTGRWTPQRSLRLRRSASTYLTRTFATPTNTNVWSLSGWVKRGLLGTQISLFGASVSGVYTSVSFLSGDTLRINLSNGTNAQLVTTQVFRDPSAWYHITIAYDSTQAVASNRIKLYVNGIQVSSFSTANYPSQNVSAEWNWPGSVGTIGTASTEYFDGHIAEVNFIDGQALTASSFGATDPTTGTWVPKRYTGTYGTNGFYLPFNDNTSLNGNGGTTSASFAPGLGAWTTINKTRPIPNNTVVDAIGFWSNSSESGKYSYIVRDNGSNSYTVVASTASYTHNGTGLEYVPLTSQYTIPSTGTYYMAVYCPGSGLQWGHDTGGSTTWTYYNGSASGTATWSVGTQSYLEPALTYRTASMGLTADRSGSNTVYWTANNISLTAGTTYDSMVDVPGLPSVTGQTDVGGVQRGNYCTLNTTMATSYNTYYDGGLRVVGFTSSSIQAGTIGVSSGKWYWESVFTGSMGGQPFAAGLMPATFAASAGYPGAQAGSGIGYYYDGTKYSNGTGAAGYGASYTLGDVIGTAFDADNGTVTFYKNNVSQGVALSGITGTWLPAFSGYSGNLNVNFGQRPFTYAPPAGFKTLNTVNLPNPVIKRPSEHFDVKTWTGNGNLVTVGTTAKQTTAYKISRSLRMRSSASPALTRTQSSSGNGHLFTYSAWVKRGALGSGGRLLCTSAGVGNTNSLAEIYFDSSTDKLTFFQYTAGTTYTNLVTAQTFKDPSAWYHIIVAYDDAQSNPTNRVKMYVNGAQVTSFTTASYPSQNFNSFLNTTTQPVWIGPYTGNSNYFDGYLSEVNFIDGQALTPSSFGQFDANNNWFPKAYTGTYGTNGFYLSFSDNSSRMALGHSDTGSHIDIVENDGSNQSIQAGVGACRVSTISTSNASFPSAVNEYLIVTPSAPIPISSSLKLYFDINYAWANGRNLYINGTQVSSGNVSVATVSGMQEWTINYSGHGITQLTSMTTPQNSGGRTVFYGISIDGSAVISTANDFTPTNISVTAGVTYDSMLDSPSSYEQGGDVRGNYYTLNPRDSTGSAYHTVYGGNLNWQTNTSVGGSAYNATGFAGGGLPSTGLWYFEITVNSINAANTGYLYLQVSGVYIWWTYSGQYQIVGSNGTTNIGGLPAGSVLQVAVNSSTGKVWYGLNNTWYTTSGTPDPAAGTGAAHSFIPSDSLVYANIQGRTGNSVQDLSFNFGQRPFVYTPPTGFKSLNSRALQEVGSYNLPDTFGNFVNTPDLVWIKNRTSAYNHILQDTVRGTGVYSDTTASAQQATTIAVQAFLPNGIQIGSIAGANTSGNSHVGWMWNRGKVPGFDVVSYAGNGVAGNQIPHNLGQAPKLMIVKSLSAVSNSWFVYHASIGAGVWTALNLTNAATSDTTVWNNTSPPSTHFTLGTNTACNGAGQSYIAYLWAEVPGFSKFGSYVGNGSADGTFVYCGFRPKFVLAKRTDAVDGWYMLDAARDSFNPVKTALDASSTAVEFATADRADFLSNGFKLKASAAGPNISGGTYIYAAFAEAPFKYANAR